MAGPYKPVGVDADSLFPPRVETRLANTFTTAVPITAYGAVGDGITDDTSAIQAALDSGFETYLPPGRYLISLPITVAVGRTLTGAGSGNYGQGASGEDVSEIVVKAGTMAAAGVVVKSKGNIAHLRVRAEVPVTYSDANYPAGTGNIATGVLLGDSLGSATATDVFVEGFASYGIHAKAVSKISSCFVRMCDIGYFLDGPDGWMDSSTAMFCHTAGVDVSGAFWRFTSNRLEWNARYGISASAEATYIGNLFDRNGWAGLYLESGMNGQVITGNYFARNGCGGDGTNGRWGFTSPADLSYVETTAAQSCHILIDYQRGVVITGNRFRAGGDDNNAGMSGPAYIVSSGSAPSATLTSAIVFDGNAGVHGTESIGYNASAYANVGAIAGGSDTTLATFLNTRFNDLQRGINTAGSIYAVGDMVAHAFGTNVVSSGSITTLNVDIPKKTNGRSGRILLRCANASTTGLAEIYFGSNAAGSGYQAVFTNIMSALVSGVTYASLDSSTDRIQITLSAAAFCTYILEYAN